MTTSMFGAIVGDIAGSKYEHHNCKSYRDIEIFKAGSHVTDDTILTLATADYYILNHNGISTTFQDVYRDWANRYPQVGYGRAFRSWFSSDDKNPPPYNSWGNGAAMRVSPIAWMAHKDLTWVLEQAKLCADVTHNHPEGVKGAEATAAAIFLARTGHDKEEIRSYLTQKFDGYDLTRTVAQIRPTYSFSTAAAETVPEAIIAFLDSKDFLDAIRLAISLGGDSDTIAAIAGSIAQAYYATEIPDWMAQYCRTLLRHDQIQVLDAFWAQCAVKRAKWYYWLDAAVGRNARGWHPFDPQAGAKLESLIQKDKTKQQQCVDWAKVARIAISNGMATQPSRFESSKTADMVVYGD
eukprot:scaffold2536_cov169-Amphora_coffeaeformis.AAC.32